MRKHLLFILLFFGVLFQWNMVQAQCTPDPDCTDPEGDGQYCPAELPNAVEAEPYNEVITIIAPIQFQGQVIHHIEVFSINNIPPGMNFQCQDDNCEFWPGIARCISIYGTPEVDSWGTYQLEITLGVWIDLYGTIIYLGELTDSSAEVTIEPHLHADFSIDYEQGAFLCMDNMYSVTYQGNATADASYNWNFGLNANVISGEGQGPYEIIYDSYLGLDSIYLEVQEDVYTSPVYTDVFEVVICGSTSELTEILFSVKPNPFNDYISISTKTNESYSCRIFDISGKLVEEQENRLSGKIDLTRLQRGVYFLHLQSKNQLETLKIIKQ